MNIGTRVPSFEAGRQLSLDLAVNEALGWLGDDGSIRSDAGELKRWQSSPWTVLGWTPTRSGEIVPGSGPAQAALRASGGGPRVYGEGGVEAGR
jgi:hypothetical protein